MISDQRQGSWYAGTLYLPAYSGDCRRETQRVSRGAPSYFRRTIVRYTQFSHLTDRRLRLVLQTRLDLPWPNLPAPFITVRTIPVRQPASLPVASFRHALLRYPCLWLTFASVRLVMDLVCKPCYIVCKYHQLATGHARHTTCRSTLTEIPLALHLCR